ncbi:hypothetical protein IFR04_006975 [Cadophora malorum]|uniref:Gamma-butyrobetaine dioxygenase n=1 Tax=Cadophora malorum TaxID=108018 RepID=A0A8H7WAM0_9HELO|nr:hypothetical protein IFR04_006975 [Cadophora malorum]
MEGLCRTTRLLSVTRLSSKQCNKTVRSFSISLCQQRCDGQTRLTRRPTALPRGSRNGASQLRRHSSRRSLTKEEWQTKTSPDGIPDMNLEYVKIGDSPGGFHPVFLRDACTCPKCVDPSSTQKQFQTTDIPQTIKANSVKRQENGDLTITWENDIPGFGPDHISTFPSKFFDICEWRSARLQDRSEHIRPRLWDKFRIEEELQFVSFTDYMQDDKQLFRALSQLQTRGLLLIRNVPESEESVAEIANRIGTIRDTFYGRTWDVKSVAEAKNVAYTHQFLGLHMDLLYMTNPPGFQFLHCLKNTCKGGASLFSDAFYAARRMTPSDQQVLSTRDLAYHYRNAGEHYYYERPLLELDRTTVTTNYGPQQAIKFINYSPPFQAPFPVTKNSQGFVFPKVMKALRSFADRVESPRNLFEYKLKEGECVIFNNRRVLHGRRQFDAGQGERWLKGTYIDTDVFKSKWRTLFEKYSTTEDARVGGQYVHPGKLEEGIARRAAQAEEATRVAEASS